MMEYKNFKTTYIVIHGDNNLTNNIIIFTTTIKILRVVVIEIEVGVVVIVVVVIGTQS